MAAAAGLSRRLTNRTSPRALAVVGQAELDPVQELDVHARRGQHIERKAAETLRDVGEGSRECGTSSAAGDDG